VLYYSQVEESASRILLVYLLPDAGAMNLKQRTARLARKVGTKRKDSPCALLPVDGHSAGMRIVDLLF